MRVCPTCSFLLSEHDIDCGYCRPTSVELVLVRATVAIPDVLAIPRRPPGVPTVPVPRGATYPPAYPAPWNGLDRQPIARTVRVADWWRRTLHRA